ncbi:hypothetical protein FA15DRAFT_153790 [Coprinopsis marcescibilis]|uniref:ABM domain-containing protein n=1 Tax=Coprinopsis marcescibilis TaxID=230819 RepID=A0A5C3KJ89_COPMA|nr:hypothetical protein FA15DRAFT_153790 [Coprinopsis marcescibilis]
MSSEGLLFVLGEPGSLVSEQDFNAWYDIDHAPARLTVPGFNSASRYKAHDTEKPTWLAIYDLDTADTAYNDAYKSLSADAPQYEKDLVPKLETLDRRIYKLVQTAKDSTFESSLPLAAPPFFLVVESSVSDEYHDDYNKWYTDHLQEVVDVPGCIRGRRFKLDSSIELTGKPPQTGLQHQYVVLYDWASDNLTFETNPELAEVAKRAAALEISSKIKISIRRFQLHKEFTTSG